MFSLNITASQTSAKKRARLLGANDQSQQTKYRSTARCARQSHMESFLEKQSFMLFSY